MTEEKYVEDLRLVVEGYMEPMLQHPDKAINSLAESVSNKSFTKAGIPYIP